MARKKKPGRKPKADVKRTASGAISRAGEAMVEHLPQVKVRMRLYDLSEAEARDQKAGTVIGRMRIAGQRWEAMKAGAREGVDPGITEMEYQAGLRALKVHEQFQLAVRSPGAPRTRGSEAGDMTSEDYTQWCARCEETHREMLKVVQHAGTIHRHRNLLGALDYLLWRNEEFAHMRGDLRVVLAALVPHFGLTESGKMAA